MDEAAGKLLRKAAKTGFKLSEVKPACLVFRQPDPTLALLIAWLFLVFFFGLLPFFLPHAWSDPDRFRHAPVRWLACEWGGVLTLCSWAVGCAFSVYCTAAVWRGLSTLFEVELHQHRLVLFNLRSAPTEGGVSLATRGHTFKLTAAEPTRSHRYRVLRLQAEIEIEGQSETSKLVLDERESTH